MLAPNRLFLDRE